MWLGGQLVSQRRRREKSQETNHGRGHHTRLLPPNRNSTATHPPPRLVGRRREPRTHGELSSPSAQAHHIFLSAIFITSLCVRGKIEVEPNNKRHVTVATKLAMTFQHCKVAIENPLKMQNQTHAGAAQMATDR